MSKLLDKRRDFAATLAQASFEAGRLGLWRTMQALYEATRVTGYEIADIEQGKQADLAESCSECRREDGHKLDCSRR